jgi:multiple sugar transport system permease protein
MATQPTSLAGRAGRGAVLSLACAVALFPLYWMVRTAVSPPDAVYFKGISFLPTRLTFDNFTRAWNDAHLARAMALGAVVTVSILAIQLMTCVPAAFAFAKLQFRHRNLWYGLVLAALLIPIQATAIPTYIGISRANLVDTPVALVLPFMTSAFGIFIIRQYMVTIPDALLEAARMDGLSRLQVLLRVVVPLSRPAILTFSVFSVFAHWNDYMWPLLVSRSPEMRTPPLALAVFQDAERGFDYGALTAGATIVTIPVLVLFAFAKRRFIAGISGGEVTG